MISDLNISSSVNTLQEYYNKLYNLQSTAHKSDYMLVHAEIKERLKDCNSYTELGINQGATLAAAILLNPKTVRAYDINLIPYNKAKWLFDDYVNKHAIDYNVVESDTLKCELNPVDVLYIDTLHQYEHLTKELNLHGDKVNKYIIFHDTAAQPELKKAIQEYVTINKNWYIVTDCDINVGFMTIAKREK